MWKDKNEITYNDLTKNQFVIITKLSIAMRNNKNSIVVELNDALTINFDNTFDFNSINYANSNLISIIFANFNIKTLFVQSTFIVNNNKIKSTFSFVVNKNDNNDENVISINKINKFQKKIKKLKNLQSIDVNEVNY